MTRSYEHYREEESNEDMDIQHQLEQENYHEQQELGNNEVPSTEVDLFRWILESEREE